MKRRLQKALVALLALTITLALADPSEARKRRPRKKPAAETEKPAEPAGASVAEEVVEDKAPPELPLSGLPEWEASLLLIHGDPALDATAKLSGYRSVIDEECGEGELKHCLVVIDRVESLGVTGADLTRLELVRARYLLYHGEGRDRGLNIIESVVKDHPELFEGVESLMELAGRASFPGSLPGADQDFIDRVARLTDRFLLDHPEHELATTLLITRLSLQESSTVPLSELAAAAVAYRKANPGPAGCALDRMLDLLVNLSRPWQSMGVSLLMLASPVILFWLALGLFYKREDPQSGRLRPLPAKVLMWLLVVAVVPLIILVEANYRPFSVFMLHVMHQPFVFNERNQLDGESTIFIIACILPMILLLILGTRVQRAAVKTTPAGESSAPRWLPGDFNVVGFGLWLLLAAAFAVFFEVYLGEPLYGVFLSLPLSLVTFVAAMSVMIRFYRIGPLPEGELRTLVTRTFEWYQLPLAEVWEVRLKNRKWFELFLLPSAFGRPQCYLDPVEAGRYTKKEFFSLLAHQVGHFKNQDRLKLLSMLFFASALGALIIAGGVKYNLLGGVLTNLALCLLMSGLTIGIALTEIFVFDRRADDFALKTTGLYPEYFNALVKAYGLSPAGLDLSRLDQEPSLERLAKGRLKHVLMRWQVAADESQMREQSVAPKGVDDETN